ncbi:MAG: glycosyltransferase family 2 protein, partial [Gammaproteobacteria bacterium]
MSPAPKISVVMSAYNAAAYLDDSIGSILGQSFRDFEFIIINNGSTDDTRSVLERYRKLDRRVRVYYHKQEGLAAALTYGCRLSRGQYIALQDADDISFPGRLQRQFDYIERRPGIGILGTWICKTDVNGTLIGNWCPSSNPKTLKWAYFFGMCVPCPSSMMRRDILEKLDFFRPDLLHAEDVDLWLRASSITEFGCVPHPLYKYRVWAGSKTQSHLQLVRDAHVRLLRGFIKEFLKVDPAVEAVVGLRQTRVGPAFKSFRQIRMTAVLIQDLYRKFVKENVLTPCERREISQDAAKRIASLALQASRFNTPGSMKLGIRALKLDYRLLYPSAIKK